LCYSHRNIPCFMWQSHRGRWNLNWNMDHGPGPCAISYSGKVQYHCDFVAIAVFRTGNTVLPHLHWQVLMLNRVEAQLLEKGGSKREGKYLRDLLGARLLDQGVDDCAAGAPNRFFRRGCETIDLGCIPGVLLETATTDD